MVTVYIIYGSCGYRWENTTFFVEFSKVSFKIIWELKNSQGYQRVMVQSNTSSNSLLLAGSVAESSSSYSPEGGNEPASEALRLSHKTLEDKKFKFHNVVTS
jgi:hypothetical protein